jgi:AcrR family transcriptional regulator
MEDMALPVAPLAAREQLLDAAFAEMHAHGFRGTSLERILTRTGLTKGALYHYFKSKKALGLAVVQERVAKAMQDEWINPLRDNHQPFLAIIDMIDRKKTFYDKENLRLGCVFNNLLLEMSPLDEDFRLALQAILQTWIKALCGAIEEAQKQGELNQGIDALGFARFIIATIEGAISIGKNSQDVCAYIQCLETLKNHLHALKT